MKTLTQTPAIVALVAVVALLAGSAAAQGCKSYLVARPTVSGAASSYASSSSSSAGSQTSGKLSLAGGLVLKKVGDARTSKVQVQIYVAGVKTPVYADATCPASGAPTLNCTWKVDLPFTTSNPSGPIAYVKGIVTQQDGTTCVSDVLTVDPQAAAAAATAAANDVIASALADAMALTNQAYANANAILAQYGLDPINVAG